MKKIFAFLLLFTAIVYSAGNVFAAQVSKWRAPVVDVYISKDYENYALMYKAFNEWCSASDRRFLFNLSSTKGMAKNGHVKVYFNQDTQDYITETSRPGLNYPEVSININTKDENEKIYPKMLHYAGLAMGMEESQNPKSVLYSQPAAGQSILKEDVINLFNLYGWRIPKTFRYFR